MSVPARLARETLLLTGAQLAGLAVGFVATVSVTRALGPEARGVYAWMLTLAGLGVQIAALASAQTVRAIAAQDPGAPRLAASLTLLGFAGTCLTAPLLIYGWLEPAIGRSARGLLLMAWISVPLTAAAVSLLALIQLHHRTLPILAAHVGPKLVLLAATLVLWSAGLLDLWSAVALNTVVALVQLMLLLVLLGKPSRGFRPDLALMRRLAGLLGAGWLSALGLFALPRIGFVLLGSHAPLAASGQYSVALTLTEIMSILPTTASATLGTHFARQGLPTRRAQARAALTVVLGMTALCLAASLLAPLLIPLVFGAAFAPAAGPFRALLPAVVLGSGYQVFQATLQARKRPLAIALPPLAAVAATLPAAVLLVPALGVAGAVWSTMLGFAVLALLAGYLGWSATRI